MVRKTSQKKVKFTYAERVLGALSDIQREYRKHAVHMATLRAHVRKIADSRKDKLGPQWAHWVTRAVHKLVEDGILDTADDQGNVAFTPNAKKTITAIRRDSLGPGVLPSSNMEQKIWKDVTRRFSTAVGVKRQRRKSAASANVDEEDEGMRPRKKRARKSLSSRTKADLEAQLESALRQLEEREDVDPVAQQDVSALREDLDSRDQELQELRNEIARLKQREQDAADLSMRLLTPPPTERPEPASADSRLTRRAASPVTRTLSGSLISNLTRRPTPEPSDAGELDGMTVDASQDDSFSFNPHPEHDKTLSSFNGLETPPQSSPILASYDLEATEQHESDRYAEEITELKESLESHATQLSEARAEHHRLIEERDRLTRSIASYESQLADVTTNLQSQTITLQDTQSLLAKADAALASNKLERMELASGLQASQAALEFEREQSRSWELKHASLQDEFSSAQAALKASQHAMETSASSRGQTEAELQQTKTLLVSIQEKLAEASRAIASGTVSQKILTERSASLELELKNSLAQSLALSVEKDDLERAAMAMRDNIKQVREQLVQSEQVIVNLRASNQKAQSDIAASTQEIVALKLTVSNLESNVDSLRSQLTESATETNNLRSLLEAEQISHQTVVSELSAAKVVHDTLLSDIANQVRQMTSVQQQFNEATRALDDARRLRDTLNEEHESVIAAYLEEQSTLKKTLETSQAESAELRTERDQLQSRNSRLSDNLHLITEERDELSSRLAEELVRSTQLQESLSLAFNDVQDAEEEISELRAAKAADEANIQNLKSGLSRLRQLQMDALDEVDNKMISAHTTPIPGHRRRSSIAPQLSVGWRA